MNSIIVHDGKSHQDDFLAACVCIYKLNAPAFRVKYAEEQLVDPKFWVLDQGRSFDPALHNFDHHQIEEQICSFTMILDHFYGKEYRTYLPQLKFVEIFDSYGPKPAADFAGISVENLDIVSSPIHTAMMRVFSRIAGEIVDPMYSVMKELGKEVCLQIENVELLFKVLGDSKYFEYEGIKILDTTKCVMPEGMKHDQLPTKTYCKKHDLQPQIILTIDSRQDGYRLVSINSDDIKFEQNSLSYFTHNSGFLTNFKNYEDYKKILKNNISR